MAWFRDFRREFEGQAKVEGDDVSREEGCTTNDLE
jgi:hypothetical protein